MVDPRADGAGVLLFPVKSYARHVKPYPFILILGGASSGKSEFAERMASGFGRQVLYLATASTSAGSRTDPEWKRKIGRHRGRRPKEWRTRVLNGKPPVDIFPDVSADAILLDSLALWVSKRIQEPPEHLEESASHLVRTLRARAPLIVVSDEVGMGMVPLTRVGRRFLESLGRVNAKVALEADDVFFVVSGQAIRIKKKLTGRKVRNSAKTY